MRFYKLTRDGKTIFATMSDGPVPNPDYKEISQEEYEVFVGYPLPPAPDPPPTAEELQAELTATRRKLDAAIQSSAMLEDCIVEMAQVVYA